MLEAQGLCKSYGSRAVVADLSLTVARARSSACSARTAPASRPRSRCCAAWSAPTSGRVFVGEGRRASSCPKRSPRQAAHRRRAAGALDLREPRRGGQPRAVRCALRSRRRAAGNASTRRWSWSAWPTAPGQAADLQRRHEAAPEHRRRAGPRPRRADLRRAHGRRRPTEPQRHLRQPRACAAAARRCSTRRTTWKRPSGSATASSSWITAGWSRVTRSQGLYKRLPVVDTLELEVDGTVDLAALGREPGISRPTQDGTRLHRGRRRPRPKPRRRCSSWLAAHGHAVHRISSGRADLEDVFLSLTGRQLRDSP